MADPLGVIEPVIQVLMAPMKWATRVLQWAEQEKAVPSSDRYLCNRVLEGGIASNRRSDMLR